MRKIQWVCYILSLCSIVAAILLRDYLDVLDILLMIVGIAIFLTALGIQSIRNARRCPNCNAIIYGGHIRTIIRTKDGIYPCEKCGSLISVKPPEKE